MILEGDCLEVMRGMESDSVDAVVTDPPYGQTNESYDKGVPQEVWDECFRVAKPNAALISFAGSPTYHRIAGGIEAAGWRVRQMWGWVYRDGFMTTAYPKEGFDRLAPGFDPICYATKGKVLLNVQREGDVAWKRNRGGDKPGFSGRERDHGCPEALGRYPRSLVSDGAAPFDYFVLSRTSPVLRQERVAHPNQKPLALMRWLVCKLPPGGMILDPFAGSGTTGVAAILEGFEPVLVERDPEYVEIIERRLEWARKEARDTPLTFFANEATRGEA